MTDSTFVFNARPLTYFVQTLFAAWDYQKIALIGNSRKRINTNVTSVTNTADDDSEENEDFIDEVSFDYRL